MNRSTSIWQIGALALPLVMLSGCAVEPPRHYAPQVVYETPMPRPPVYVPPSGPPVVSVYSEPPIGQPEPVAIAYAPPPMLVEVPPPPPYPGAVWIGGFWVWHGAWVWNYGRWDRPPLPNYHWVHPYYEHRDGLVIFVTGHWAEPQAVFVPPSADVQIKLVSGAFNARLGFHPVGPNGCFVPPPPGSAPGLIVPAPIGTPPAVVSSAPPVIKVGMHITNNVNNTTVINNVMNVTNITHVNIVAPPGVTTTGQPVQAVIPVQAHLAAALPPVIRAIAPQPATQQTIPAFSTKPQQPTQNIQVSNRGSSASIASPHLPTTVPSELPTAGMPSSPPEPHPGNPLMREPKPEGPPQQLPREESQREQAQRQQAQREEAQREQAQRQQAQREEAQREQPQREETRRERIQLPHEKPENKEHKLKHEQEQDRESR